MRLHCQNESAVQNMLNEEFTHAKEIVEYYWSLPRVSRGNLVPRAFVTLDLRFHNERSGKEIAWTRGIRA